MISLIFHNNKNQYESSSAEKLIGEVMTNFRYI